MKTMTASASRKLTTLANKKAMPAVKASPAKKSAPVGSAEFEVNFSLVAETKGALRFEEEGFQKDNMDATKIGTLYLRKAAFPSGRFPQHLTVTITTVDGE